MSIKKYTYTVDNQQIDTLDLSSIPDGVNYIETDFEEYTELVIVPEEITALQFFSQLLLEGITETAIRETIDYLVANEQLPSVSGELAKISLRKANVFERNNPFISVIGLAFNKTEIELDNIFINASNL